MRFFGFLLLFSTFLTLPTLAETTSLCGIRIEGYEKIEFSSTERDWLCGSAKSPAWQNMPNSQRTLFLKGFLQSRGYHQSTFTSTADSLNVELGPRSTLQTLEVHNAPAEWNWRKRRYIKDRPFTPATLDEITNWARRRLQEHGYPCPQIDAQALVLEEKFNLTVEPGPAYRFGAITTVGEEDLNPAILDRYSAFFPGAPFDIRLLEITSNRVLQEDLYLSTYYDITCTAQGEVEIVRRMIPAKPRLLTFGLGFDSEGGALFRSMLKQARLNETADNLEASLFASLLEQTLTGKHRHYFSSDLTSRLHLLTTAMIKRESESSYEAMTYQLGTSLALGWEALPYSGVAQVGPLIERTDVMRGPEPYQIDALRIAGEINLTSHLYEYFLTNPQDGWSVTLNASSQVQGALSDDNIHRLTLRHQIIWNLNEWDPPFLVLGWRGWVGTFILPDGENDSPDIPVTQRFFLGGDADLRGFARKQLPASDNGFLTVLYQGLELRANDILPYNLQPLIFLDAAKAGILATELDSALYYSPGVGLRWGSPIGTIRGTVGRGFVVDRDSSSINPGYQFFVSFGKEF